MRYFVSLQKKVQKVRTSDIYSGYRKLLTGCIAPSSLAKGEFDALSALLLVFCEAGAKAAAEARRVDKIAVFMVIIQYRK